MATAFSSLYGEVLNRSRQSGTWATARAKAYLNEAQKLLATMSIDWKTLEKQSTASCVANQDNYALPSDFQRALAVNIEDSDGNYYRIMENPWDTFRAAKNAETSADTPTIYTIHYQQLWLHPKPDTTYTMRLDYIYSPADMSSDADTSPFADHILIQYSIAHLKRDLGRFDEYQIEYQIFKDYLNEYIGGQDKAPDRLDGMGIGMSGVTPYWQESW